MSTTLVKVALLAGAAAVGFGAGWGVNGWRMGAEVATLKQQHAEAVTASYSAGMTEQARLQALKDEQNKGLAVIDADELAKLRSAQNENETLRGRVAAGSVRLRVAAVCPPPVGNVPPPGPSGGVDTGAGPSLTADAEQAYLSLRAGIPETERKLAACQRSAALLTGQTAPTVPPRP